MRTGICWVAVLACVIVTEVAAAPENNSSAKQSSPLMVAQAATPQPDYILKGCQETTSIGDPISAWRAVDPAFMLKNYLEWHDKTGTLVVDFAAIKTTLLENTKHGEITTEIDNTGRTSYGYDPVPAYTGKDRAVFLAEFEGKVYKIVVELRVGAVEALAEPSLCPEPQLIKVTKPASGSSGYELNSVTIASYTP